MRLPGVPRERRPTEPRCEAAAWRGRGPQIFPHLSPPFPTLEKTLNGPSVGSLMLFDHVGSLFRSRGNVWKSRYSCSCSTGAASATSARTAGAGPTPLTGSTFSHMFSNFLTHFYSLFTTFYYFGLNTFYYVVLLFIVCTTLSIFLLLFR